MTDTVRSDQFEGDRRSNDLRAQLACLNGEAPPRREDRASETPIEPGSGQRRSAPAKFKNRIAEHLVDHSRDGGQLADRWWPFGHASAHASRTTGTRSSEFARRFELFSHYGNFTMGFSTLQPELKYFEAHGGYLAYDRALGVDFVLADPVAPRENHRKILADFIEGHPRSCFCQASRPVAEILSELGYFVNEMGADLELDLPNYDFSGSKKSKFRQAANKVEREGYTIEERTSAEVDPLAIERLCSSWRATKTVKREARFLTRPIVFEHEPDVRKFYLVSAAGEIVSFVTFDPICENGRVIGYSPSVKRRGPNAPTGAEEAVCKFAIERFREEGMKSVRLGLLPLYQVDKSEFCDSFYLRKVFQLLYRHGDRWVYSFRGHADFKHRYRGESNKVYFGTYTRWRNVQSLIGLMLVCRIFGASRQTPVNEFSKPSRQGRLVSTRTTWGSPLHPQDAGQVVASSFCSHRRAPSMD